MLAVLRFSFTKDLKFIVSLIVTFVLPAAYSTCAQHGKVCKPYNSVLGEHFRAHWDVSPIAPSDDATQIQSPYSLAGPPKYLDANSSASETASVKSGKSSKSTRSGLSSLSKPGKSPSTAPTTPQPMQADVADQMSNLNLNGNAREPSPLRVVFLTEQVSHHPPVSAYYVSCPARSLELYGIDQISAKVSGTAVKVYPGQFNQGIFVNVTGGPGQGETYKITHPIASVNGILRGSFYLTVSDSVIITCASGKHGQRFRAISEYKEEVQMTLITPNPL
jgi:oxysterol-binding protein-related protein 9/10/11